MTVNIEWPWQYNFPPFFTIQQHEVTLREQLSTWRQLVLDFTKANKQCVIDVREAQRCAPFRNSAIDRRLSEEGILTVLRDLARIGNAEAVDKTQTRWYIYWETLEQIGSSIYKWAIDRGMTGSVCTFYEIISGDSTTGESFYGLDEDILLKALQWLQSEKKAEIIYLDDSKGVKFF